MTILYLTDESGVSTRLATGQRPRLTSAPPRCRSGGQTRVAGGEWRVASGEWRVASGEWRVANAMQSTGYRRAEFIADCRKLGTESLATRYPSLATRHAPLANLHSLYLTVTRRTRWLLVSAM